MKAADLRDLTRAELMAKLKEVSEELFNLNFQHSRQQLDNTARLGQARKDLARVKTVLRGKAGAKGYDTPLPWWEGLGEGKVSPPP